MLRLKIDGVYHWIETAALHNAIKQLQAQLATANDEAKAGRSLWKEAQAGRKRLRLELDKANEENERPVRIKMFRICSHCNKEFEVETAIIVTEAVKGITGHIANFIDCPLCKKRNDIWVRIQALKGE